MKKFLSYLAIFFLTGSAMAAGPTPPPGVTQSGSVTSGHCVSWAGNKKIQDTGSACGSGTGTVSSVGLSMPGVIFNATVPGSPVTSSGTLAPTLLTQTQNTFFGAPNGSGGTPTFRTLASADLPLTLQNSTAATTQSATDNSTLLATDAFVNAVVNNALAGVNPAVAVQAATTTAANTASLTYNNGASGVGATFTGVVNTAFTVDGFTFNTVGQRVLVKNDTQSPSGAFNGIYSVTQVQSAILPVILTRTLDYNTPSSINNTGAIPVINGTLNGTTTWVETALVTTVGTSPLAFTQFSFNPASIVMSVTGDGTVFNNSASTGTVTLTPVSQVKNTVYSGPATGSNAAATFRVLAGADLPNPSASTLGGVESLTAVSHNFLTSISTSGVPAQAQPAFTDISGSVAAGQMPALTGDVTTSAGAVTTTLTLSNAHAWTAQQNFAASALTPGTSVAWNVTTAQVATLAPVQSFTLSNPTNLVAGGTYIIKITQDATGSRVITWGSVYKFPGGTKFVLSTAANAVDVITCISDGTNMYCVGQAAFS